MRSILSLFLVCVSLGLAQTPEIPAPAMVYGTFLPVGGFHSPSVATDAAGDIYVATADSELAMVDTPAGVSPVPGPSQVTVTRVRPGSREPVYTVTLGEGQTAFAGIAVSDDGHAFVTGQFSEMKDIVLPPGETTGFVSRLAPDGTVLYTTLFQADAAAIAIDAVGNAYVTGTAWDDFETTLGAYKAVLDATTRPAGEGGSKETICPDAFILKLDPEGNILIATYLGGSMEERGGSIAVDAAGNVYVGGDTMSADFPRTIGAAQPEFGGRGVSEFGLSPWGDGFVVKFEPTVRRLEYATYLGGTRRDNVYDLAVDDSGSIVAVGSTASPDLPVTPGVIQPDYRGQPDSSIYPDGFAMKLTPTGAFAYVTYFGSSLAEDLTAVTLGNDGSAYVAGGGYVEQDGAPEPTPCDPPQHLTILSADGSAILGTTYLGSRFTRRAPQISEIDGQMISVALPTVSGQSPVDYRDTFATTPDAIDTRGDAYIATFDFATPTPSLACVVNGASFETGHWDRHLDYVVSPHEILTFFGRGLDEAELTIGGQPAPILYAGYSQINAVAPGSLEPGAVPIELIHNGQVIATYEAGAIGAVPALFSSDGSGEGNAAAWNQDRTRNGPDFPAKRGSIVELYATGFGRLSPMPPDGSTTPLEPSWPELAHRFSAWIQAPVESGAVGMEVLYAGPAPGLITGVIQINVRIPEDAATGDEVLIQFILDNEERTQQAVTLAVGP